MTGEKDCCKNCMFFVCMTDTEDTCTGECRRGPQQVVMYHYPAEKPEETERLSSSFAWPFAIGVDWCGEHRREGEPAEEETFDITKILIRALEAWQKQKTDTYTKANIENIMKQTAQSFHKMLVSKACYEARNKTTLSHVST